MEQLIMQTNIIRDGAVLAAQGEDIRSRLKDLEQLGYGPEAIKNYERLGIVKRVVAEE